MTNKKILIFLFGVFIYLFTPNIVEAQTEDILMKIVHANESYYEKNYQSAAETFESIVALGQHNGYLYYNLGNTYMRLGNTGKAILYYLRAKELLPRNENLDANLRYSINQTVDKLPPLKMEFAYGLMFWIDSISLTEHLHSLIIVNVIFWSISIGLLYYRKSLWSILKNVSMVFLLIICFSTGIKYYLTIEKKTGVVLKNKVNIKSDRDIQDITLFQLHEGAIISVNQEVGDWVHISLDKDKSGWVPKVAIGY